ncbi:MAG TPA: aminopeptidase P family protein [Acidimicrobiales bacterium]|nr:aminopeptidase P family protein [Acidimicrobiales bacterium]
MTGAALPPLDRAARLDRLRGALDDVADAVLVTHLVNTRWLVGFTGSSGWLLVGPDRATFVTDGRYGEQAAAELDGLDVELVVTSTPATAVGAAGSGFARVALEAAAVTWDQQRTIATEWLTTAELVPTVGLVEALRERKEPGEIARIEAAAAIADAALGEVVPMLRAGPTEAEVALALEVAMRRLGADGPAFDTIVASGPASARPHHRPDARVITTGDLVVIDMGARVDGYCSDMTRTFVVGEPSAEQARMLAVVTAAQAAGVAAAGPGVPTADVDAAARQVIADAGWADAFVHPTGHGLGLEIHEALRVAATSTATLAVGHAVTVEPGVYLPGVGGVRVEDTVEITPDGCRPLTRSPKASTLA